MSKRAEVAFLFDVDNTLLDNDRVIEDLKRHLAQAFTPEGQKHYWNLFEKLREEVGYADYLGAIQRYRCENPRDPNFVKLSLFLLDYHFAERLYPEAIEVIRHVRRWGTTAIVSDGDAVFQPRKIERSGLLAAVGARALIYIHKERDLEDVECHFPADHYVLIDDKLRVLSAAKTIWKDRVTTIFPRQGHYALDPAETAKYPPADVIGDLLHLHREQIAILPDRKER